MAESPSVAGDNVVRVTVKAAGQPLTEGTAILSIDVHARVNAIPRARVVLVDGDIERQAFPLSDSRSFVPGTEIEIEAGYEDTEVTIFKGIIVSHALKISGENDTRLVLECRDKAVKMTVGRRNATFQQTTDGDVIKQIVADAGLAPDVSATTTTYGELLQHYCTDWDFILSRAEVNGLIVTTEDGKVTVKPPAVSGAAPLVVTYGDDLIEFEADLDARYQLDEATAVAWDPGTQKLIESSGAKPRTNDQGDFGLSELQGAVVDNPWQLQTTGRYEDGALRDWASAQLSRAALARIRGRIKFQGNAKAKPGTLISCKGVGNRFEGNAFITSVHHRIASGGWTTETEFGLSPAWFSERTDIVAPPASGLLPGIDGLQIGVVQQLGEDPDGEYRIKVRVPIMQSQDEGVWARLASFHASSDFGAYFVPEIEDEVVLGFLNGDPSQPVVLGSLYSSNHPAPYEHADDNDTKAVVTRERMKLEFDEDKKVITVTTPAENRIVIDDDDKSIKITDQTGNEITLSPGGISLDSPKDVTISAKGKVTIDAGAQIALTATADLKAKGLNVTANADASLKATGGASAELSAGGQTTVKGAMVMIN